VSAKRAPMGYQDPQESSFGGVSGAHGSKLDRSTMWAVCGKHGLRLTSSAAFLNIRFGRASYPGSKIVPERWSGVMRPASGAASGGAAGFPGGLDLCCCPQVWFRKSYPFFCSGNLTFVPFY
jgi:hypothetical protein